MSSFHETTEEQLDDLLVSASRASKELKLQSRAERSELLAQIAQSLDAAADELVPIARGETNLPEGRLRAELKRTTFQLRLFSEIVAEGGYLGVRVDHADPEWPMGAPRPDLRRVLIPIGPIAVFAASNFPFAFSVAGGDTASALAAGCPVVVKAHPGHPLLSLATAKRVQEAVAAAGAPSGTFGIAFGVSAGRSLVTDERIKAVGFTGSVRGGRALFDLANSRETPIPFYGELGSTNPVFVTPSASENRGLKIAQEFIDSFTAGAGQFCTKPGVVAVPRESKITEALRNAELPAATPMLNEHIVENYRASINALFDAGVATLNAGDDPMGEHPSPIVHVTDTATALAQPELFLAECFGPSALVIEYSSAEELFSLASAFDGQLTASLQAERDEDVTELLNVLTDKAGRILWNQWPTGVSVTFAQHHGGPYPASTSSRSTSVGTAAIERFLRPIALQGFPDHQLPDELREQPSNRVPRLTNGRFES